MHNTGYIFILQIKEWVGTLNMEQSGRYQHVICCRNVSLLTFQKYDTFQRRTHKYFERDHTFERRKKRKMFLTDQRRYKRQ